MSGYRHVVDHLMLSANSNVQVLYIKAYGLLHGVMYANPYALANEVVYESCHIGCNNPTLTHIYLFN